MSCDVTGDSRFVTNATVALQKVCYTNVQRATDEKRLCDCGGEMKPVEKHFTVEPMWHEYRCDLCDESAWREEPFDDDEDE